MPIPAEDRPLPQAPAVTRRVEYSTCYMCACRCGIQVTLENDELRFIQGNARPSGQPGRALREGLGGDHEAALAGQASQAVAAQAGRASAVEPSSRRSSGTRRLRSSRRDCARIRATDPRKLAFFTGRDQMQALTGLWAQQFGTPNWAAHGGFCSVNMAAAGLYSIGFSFWEFGAPDWDRAKYFVLWGVAEDHSSNPIKIGLDKLKRNRREVRLDQSDSHRLFGDRRRMGADPAGHRWAARAGDRARAAARRDDRLRSSWRATPMRRGS